MTSTKKTKPARLWNLKMRPGQSSDIEQLKGAMSKSANKAKITLPRLKFMEKKDDAA